MAGRSVQKEQCNCGDHLQDAKEGSDEVEFDGVLALKTEPKLRLGKSHINSVPLPIRK
jgi:hypothetical protein